MLRPYEIDRYELDRELAEHPHYFHSAAEKLAEAREELENAKLEEELKKAALEDVKAELDLSVRSSPMKYGLDGDKLREGAIEKAVLLSSRYQEAREKYFKAKRWTNKCKSKVGSLEVDVDTQSKRGYDIGKLVDLFLGDYFSHKEPPISYEGRRRLEKQEKAAVRRMGQTEED